MRFLWAIGLAAMLGGCAGTQFDRDAGQSVAVALQGAAQPDQRPTYFVRRVIDGDTIEIVDAGGIRTRVRLRRVNAPELSEPGGAEAREQLSRRLLGRRVHVTPYARDKYGRTVADIELASH